MCGFNSSASTAAKRRCSSEENALSDTAMPMPALPQRASHFRARFFEGLDETVLVSQAGSKMWSKDRCTRSKTVRRFVVRAGSAMFCRQIRLRSCNWVGSLIETSVCVALYLTLSVCSVDTRKTFDFFIRRIKKINRYVEVRSLLSYELISINHYFHQNDSLSASVVR